LERVIVVVVLVVGVLCEVRLEGEEVGSDGFVGA